MIAGGDWGTVEQACAELRAGRPVLVVDHESRENEGDVVLAAQTATAAWVGWAVRFSSGFLCAPMTSERADYLELPDMVAKNQDPRQTAYTITVDAAAGISTGISAADRARTARVLADPRAQAADLIRPGHVVPLRARPGGVLERPGHTEAAVDLCLIAGLEPVALIAELVHDDGSMRRGPAILQLAEEHQLLALRIADLVQWRRAQDRLPVAAPMDLPQDGVQRAASTIIPTPLGEFTAYGFREYANGTEHLVLVKETTAPPLVRIHSECLTGDVLGSLRCDCGPQWQASVAQVSDQGGVLIYLRGHEGRGVGLVAKLRAYALQDAGRDTVQANTDQGLPADARDYSAAAAILRDLGWSAVRLLTNNPEKVKALVDSGISVVQRIPLEVGVSDHNRGYLSTKRDRMGHLLSTNLKESP